MRVCERISGSIGRSAAEPNGSLPVKTARPRAAETPQRNAAEAMKKYPRRGCGRVCLEFAISIRRNRFDDQAADMKRSRRELLTVYIFDLSGNFRGLGEHG